MIESNISVYRKSLMQIKVVGIGMQMLEMGGIRHAQFLLFNKMNTTC